VYKDIWSKKNKLSPGDVKINSHKQIWFDCDVCNHDYIQIPNKKSIGCQFCINRKLCGALGCNFCLPKSCHVYSDIWSDKNEILPRKVAMNSNKRYYFDCHGCNHDYIQRPSNKTSGQGCPFCSNHKICGSLSCLFCLKKSCYVYKDIWSIENKLLPHEVTISNGKKYLFNCQICNHNYDQTPANKTIGKGCPFCGGQKICGILNCGFCLSKSCHIYKDIWSINNITRDSVYIKPETISISNNKKYIFVCHVCKHDYEQTPGNKTNSGQGCPYCVNKTEQMVVCFLKETNINFVRQYKIGDINKFYDFYLPDKKLIIEVDGDQHFKQISNWKSPEENLQNDIQKMKTAIANGISVLRIYQPDIFSDIIDWKDIIKKNLYTRNTPTVTTVARDPEIYNNHHTKSIHSFIDFSISSLG
jgi:very-short-patch-repair endonuclease